MKTKLELINMNEIIKVIGVGGGGSNAVNHMYNQGIKGVDFVVCNTDRQALDISPVPCKIQLGKTLTEGRGAGMIPEVGMNAAFENIEELRELLSANTKMVFVTAGMGGGTGTGAAPVIAQISKELGILTVGIVTLPFAFEGPKRKQQAEVGLERLRKNVDTLLVINNEKLLTIGKSLGLKEGFEKADNILTVAAKGIATVIAETGLINVDFNDVNTVLRNSGKALMGSASAAGETRAIEAVQGAMNSPLLNDHDIFGAAYVLLNITYGDVEILMDEIMQITDFIQDAAGDNAEVIWGYGYDSSLEDKLSVTLVATGFSAENSNETHHFSERKVVPLNPEEQKEITNPLFSPLEGFSSPNNSQNSDLITIKHSKADETQDFTFEVKPSQLSVNNTQNNVNDKVQPELKSIKPTGLFPESTDLNTDYSIPANKNDKKASAIEFEFIWEVPTSNGNSEPQEAPKSSSLSTSDVNDFSNRNVKPISNPSNTGNNEVIRHQLNLDEGDTSNPKMNSSFSQEEIQRRNNERVAKINEITAKIQNSENLSEYESQPAYLRRNLDFPTEKPSEEQRMSRFGLSDNGNGETSLGNNSFLHDNVD